MKQVWLKIKKIDTDYKQQTWKFRLANLDHVYY